MYHSGFSIKKEREVSVGMVMKEKTGSAENITYKNNNSTFFLKTSFEQNTSTTQKLMYECNMLKSLVHPNILSIEDYMINEKRHLLITQNIEQGDLLSIINSEKLEKKLPIQKKIKIANQIIDAIKYIHSQNKYHGNINQENIYLKLVRGEYHAYVSGFKEVTIDSLQELAQKNFPDSFPPEYYYLKNSDELILTRDTKPPPPTNDSGQIDFQKFDSYGLGIVLFQLFFETAPFYCKDKRCPRFKALLNNDISQFWASLEQIGYPTQSLINQSQLEEIQRLVGNLILFNYLNRVKVSALEY